MGKDFIGTNEFVKSKPHSPISNRVWVISSGTDCWSISTCLREQGELGLGLRVWVCRDRGRGCTADEPWGLSNPVFIALYIFIYLYSLNRAGISASSSPSRAGLCLLIIKLLYLVCHLLRGHSVLQSHCVIQATGWSLRKSCSVRNWFCHSSLSVPSGAAPASSAELSLII